MSDTAAGNPVTGANDPVDGAIVGGAIPPSIPVIANVLRTLAMRAPTEEELAALAENPAGRLAIEQGLLRPLGQAFQGAVTWIRSQLYDEAAPSDAVNALSRFDSGYAAAGREFNAVADSATDWVALGEGAVTGAALGYAAGVLLSLAEGSPDTQGPALQPGSEWNPAGGPAAPSSLPDTPLQVIAVATEPELIAAINKVNSSPGNYAIHITSSITLISPLPAIVQPIGSVHIDGEGHFLSGSGVFRGLVVNGTDATVRNLTIQDAAANGAAGGQAAPAGEGGDGAGLLAVNNAHVKLVNVAFTGDTAQLGGGVYADPSSSITVNGGSFSGDTATGSQGTSAAGNGQGDGSDIFLAGEQVLAATAKPGQTTTVDGGIADQAGQGGVATVVAEGGGTVVLTGTGSFSGGVVVTADTTLVLADAQAAGPGGITFDSQGTGILRIDPAALSFDDVVGPKLSGMMAGDSVDLVGLSGATQVSVETQSTPNPASNGPPVTSVFVSNGTQTDVLHFTGLNAGAQFALASDGNGGTLLTMTQTMPAPTGLSETSTDGVLTFSGSAQAGSTVTLYQLQLGTKTLLQLGTVTVGSNGQFSLTPGTQPDAGAGIVTAVATDSQGNASALSDGVALPAGTGGTPPVFSKGLVRPLPGSIVIRVGTEQQLIAAIDEANAGTAQTSLAIQFTNNITLHGADDLPALEDKAGVQILGEGYTLQGDGETRGFLLFGANATIDNLNISGMVARGGAGGGGAAGGGGGAGLGGGLLAVGHSHVKLDDVHFTNDSAVGGAGGPSASTAGGGGGGMGGAGGNAMPNTSMDISGGGGGVGNQAYGGSGGPAGQTAGGPGIIAGAPSDQGNSVDGGGGAGGTPTKGGNEGGGGGVYGLSGSDGSTGNWGGGGGGNDGAGNDKAGGDGEWGGGGGGDSREGGHGGFGGGGGGGTPTFSAEGTSGGFGGGRGGSGTNNSADSGGGGGAGMGGALFVAQGSSVTIENSSTSGSSVAGGQGESGGQDGQAYGSDMFIEANQSVVLAATAGRTTTFTGVIADETGSHDQSGATGAGSLIIEGKGTVVLDASNTYTGGTVIDRGNLELGTAGAAGSGKIDFVAPGALKIDQAAMQENNVITGFSQGDSIDLAGVAWSEGTSATVVGTSNTPDGTSVMQVSVSNSSGQQEQLLFHFKGSTPKTFVTTSDGHGGTKLTLAASSNTADAPVSSPAAGNTSNLGSNDPRADLSVALQRTPPAPGVTPDAHSGAGSAAAGPDPTPEAAHVAVPGADESHTIAPAVQGSESNPSSHHAR